MPHDPQRRVPTPGHEPTPSRRIPARPSAEVPALTAAVERARLLVLRHRPRRLLVALVAALVAWSLVRHATTGAAAARENWRPVGPVLVVRSPIAAGGPITPADVEYRPVPASVSPPDALTHLPPDATALDELAPGEVLRAGRVRPPGLSVTAARLGPGQRGVVLDGAAVTGLELGDHVELRSLATGGVVARGARVVRLGEAGDATIAVDGLDVERVVDALATGGVVAVLTP